MDTESLPGPGERADAPGEPPGLERLLVIGLGVAVTASIVGVGGAFLVGGQGWEVAIGMGIFVAFWGGLGFGGMVAGVVWATRVDEAVRRDEQRVTATRTLQAAPDATPNDRSEIGGALLDASAPPERAAS
jgi:hypothetical protein